MTLLERNRDDRDGTALDSNLTLHQEFALLMNGPEDQTPKSL